MSQRTLLVLAATACILTLASCAPTVPEAAAPTPTSTAWGYDDDGPAHWDAVALACKNTEAAHESPIDIDRDTLVFDGDAGALEFSYQPTAFELENNGHTMEAVPEDLTADFITLDGETFYLQQFHFHATSEHLLNGRPAAAELHLVHSSDDGDIVVLGVLIQPGGTSNALDELFEEMPGIDTDAEVELDRLIDPSALIPEHSASARYEGSLTTPPCTEGVQWNVFLDPIHVSGAQLDAFTSVYSDNHRPVQPLHGREVVVVLPA